MKISNEFINVWLTCIENETTRKIDNHHNALTYDDACDCDDCNNMRDCDDAQLMSSHDDDDACDCDDCNDAR